MKLTELEDELRLLFEERAADVIGDRPAPPRRLVDPGTIAHTTEVVRDHRHRPLATVAAAIGLIALVATAVVVFRPSSDTLVPAGTPGPLFVLPAADGPEITSASMSSSADFRFGDADLLVFAVEDDSGRLTDVVNVWSAPPSETRGFAGEQVTIELANGRLEAFLGGPTVSVAGVMNGTALLVRSDLTLDETIDALADVEVVDGRARLVDSSDFVVVGELDGFDEVRFDVDLQLGGPEFEINTFETTSETFRVGARSSEEAVPTRIRGREGWAYPRADVPSAIQWMETDRHGITISAPLPVDELVEIAEGLRVVDAAEWLRAADPVLDWRRPPGNIPSPFLLPSEDGDVAVLHTETTDGHEASRTALRLTTFGRQDQGRLTDLVNVYLSEGEPSTGDAVSVELANHSIEFRSISPDPGTQTILEADLGNRLLGVTSALPVDDVRSVLAEVEIDDDGRARLVAGSRFVTVSSTATPSVVVAVGDTHTELDTPSGRVVLETVQGGVDPLAVMPSLASELRLVAVRGVPAWASDSEGRVGIGWRETDEQTVVLSGHDGISIDDLLRVAADLEVVDQEAWLAAAG